MIKLAGTHHGINNGRLSGSVVGTSEEIIFTANGYRADSVFYKIVVYLHLRVVDINQKFRPLIQGVRHRFANEALWEHFDNLIIKPLLPLFKHDEDNRATPLFRSQI